MRIISSSDMKITLYITQNISPYLIADDWKWTQYYWLIWMSQYFHTNYTARWLAGGLLTTRHAPFHVIPASLHLFTVRGRYENRCVLWCCCCLFTTYLLMNLKYVSNRAWKDNAEPFTCETGQLTTTITTDDNNMKRYLQRLWVKL